MEKTRVLIVEDQKIHQLIIGKAITDSGRYEIIAAIENADISDLFVESGNIDLVLMDIFTAYGSNGLEAAERIKKDHPEVKIVIMTSAPETEWITRAKNAGVDSFWFKETNTSVILSICDRTLAGESVYPI